MLLNRKILSLAKNYCPKTINLLKFCHLPTSLLSLSFFLVPVSLATGDDGSVFGVPGAGESCHEKKFT